jgi:hypothetical protein
LASFQGVSIAMELSIMLPDVVQPPEALPDDCIDDSGRSCNAGDVVSMQFNTPASITIRHPTRSPRVDLMEKRKRLEYPLVVSAETSDPRSVHVSVPVALSNLDSAPALFSPIVPEIDQPISSPDVREILDPGYVPCPFDLGISYILRKTGPDVKPFNLVGLSDVPVKSGREVTHSHVSKLAVDSAEVVNDAGDAVNVSDAVAGDAVSGPLDEISDDAFNQFIPSVLDCELSDSDDGTLSEDGKSNKELEPGITNNVNPRWGRASATEYEAVRKGGVRKSKRVESWANKAFDKWRVFRGHRTDESIADLSEKPDVNPLVDLLVQYFLELKTQKCILYSPGT